MAKIKPLVLKKIKNYIDDISNICQIERVVLFGSYAKGSQERDSDIDLAVFSSEINDSNRHRYMSLFLRHILKYKLDIQPVAFSLNDYESTSDSFITDETKKKGIILYTRQ